MIQPRSNKHYSKVRNCLFLDCFHTLATGDWEKLRSGSAVGMGELTQPCRWSREILSGQFHTFAKAPLLICIHWVFFCLSHVLIHHCINPSKAAAPAVELGHLIFLSKKPVLSWQALVQYPWCPPGGVPQGHGLQRLFPGNGTGQ